MTQTVTRAFSKLGFILLVATTGCEASSADNTHRQGSGNTIYLPWVSNQDEYLPDLVVDPQSLRFNYVDNYRNYPQGEHGNEYKLNFQTAVRNIGSGKLELTAGEVVGETQLVNQVVQLTSGSTRTYEAGTFVYHPEHGTQHFHVDNMFLYTLIPQTGAAPIDNEEGFKLSFCMYDVQPGNIYETPPNYPDFATAPQGPEFRDCSNVRQGISVGWQDNYGEHLEGQAFLLAQADGHYLHGKYILEITVDPAGHIRESSEDNNTASVEVWIGAPSDADTFDAVAFNGDMASASDIGTLDESRLIVLRRSDVNFHDVADVDVYKITIPSNNKEPTLAVAADQYVDVDATHVPTPGNTWGKPHEEVSVEVRNANGENLNLPQHVNPGSNSFRYTLPRNNSGAPITYYLRFAAVRRALRYSFLVEYDAPDVNASTLLSPKLGRVRP